MSSPRFPHHSPPNLSCTYVISVGHRFSITLNFTDFHVYSEDLEGGPKCYRHWLQVPDWSPESLWYHK